MTDPKGQTQLSRITLAACAPLSLAIVVTPVRAEEAPQPEIVVTGRGLALPPAAAAYDAVDLPADRLSQAASGRIEDALSAVAGFQQFRRSDSRSASPSAQGVTLRALGGNATSRSLVLLDGVPQADPFFGYIPLSAIDLGSLAAARVTRGGGAGAFGSGAVAGTIELASAGPRELGLLSGTALADDRGETDLAMRLAPRLGAGFAVLSGQWNRGEGFWTTPADQRVPASVRARYRVWSLGARAVAPLGGDVELQARLAAFDDRRTLRFAGADTSSTGQDASLRLVGRGVWGFEALAYLQARNFTNVVISSTTFRKTLDQYATPSTGWGGKFELRPPVGAAHLLRLGADWRGAKGTGFETAYNAVTGAVTARRSSGGRNTDLGLFAEDDWTLGRLILTGGIRADRGTIAGRSSWDVTGRGGAVLKLSEHLALRGSAYSGLRQPTLNELYRTFTQTSPGARITTNANAALVDERLEGFEAGADIAMGPGLSLALTAFDNRLRHAIANVTLSGPVNQGGTLVTDRQRFNVDAIRARGIEATLQAKSGPFTLAASLALTDAKVTASGLAAPLNGKRPAQTPKVAASATLGWQPAPGARIALTVKHVGAQFEDDLETDVLPAATTLDAYAQIPLAGPFALVLRAENLTDRTVITRNQSGSLDLGTPRTLWAGVRVGLP